MRFHPDKCKVIHVQSRSRQEAQQEHVYTMGNYDHTGPRVSLDSVSSERDIGVVVDKNLNFEKHVQNQVNKANKTVGLIRRTFQFLDRNTFKLLFKALVRPILEYASSVWCPYKVKDINSIENVQRRATKMLPGLRDLSYEDRLRVLNLPTLKHRRLRGDLIEAYKILGGIYDTRASRGLLELSDNTRTRGHSLKLAKHRSRLDIRKHFFTQRVVETWNALPDYVVTAKTVNSFKNRVDKFLKGHDSVYDMNIEFTGTGKAAGVEEYSDEELGTETQK
jgi:hypothetical protein